MTLTPDPLAEPKPGEAEQATSAGWLAEHVTQIGLASALVVLLSASYLVYRGVILDRSSLASDKVPAVQAYAAAAGLFATAMLVVVTAFYVSLTGQMVRSTSRAAAATHRAALSGQAQADAAQRAVDAAHAQAESAAAAVAVAQTQLASSVELAVSHQARLVGGYIESGPEFTRGLKAVTLTVVNASPLPIHDIEGFLISTADGHLVGRYDPVPVILGDPHRSGPLISRQQHAEVAEVDAGLRLVLDFTDDAGRRWRKYGSLEEPLARSEDCPLPYS